MAPNSKRHFTAAHPAAAAPRQRAVCGCGHVGRSATPSTYQCGGCYYLAWASSELETATRLLDRAQQLIDSAQQHRTKAAAFRARHPVPR